jgi:hypothetical protein
MQRMTEALPIRTPVMHWSDFAARNPRFLLHDDAGSRKWPYDVLPQQGWRLTFNSQSGVDTI